MMGPDPFPSHTRRAFLGKTAQGLGAVALAALLRPVAAPGRAVAWRARHIAAASKSQARDLADDGGRPVASGDLRPQAEARRDARQADAGELHRGQQLAQLQGQKLMCFGPQHPFQAFGKERTEICALFPHIGSVIDEICLIRSMTTEAINHDPAHMFMNTGSQIAGRPSMGAWVTYGLGSEADDLPGFVVLTSLGKGGQNQPIAARQWSSGFLPSRFQGVQLRAQGRPGPLPEQSRRASRAQQQGADVAAINALNAPVRHAGRTTRKSPPASPSTRWRSRCRPASRS